MKTKVSLLAVIISAFLISSCGGEKKDSGETIAVNYKLEIIDSLQFDILSPDLRVADVDTETGDMLVFQYGNPPVAWVFDKSYQVLAKFELPEDHPEAVGNFILSATFFDQGIALMGRFVVNLYDRKFNFIKSMKVSYGPSKLIMPGQKHIFDFYDENGQPQLVTYFGQPQTDLYAMNKEYYDEFNIVDVVNPALSKSSRDTVFQAIGELTPDSRYKKGRAFYFLQPRMWVADRQLYYAINDDTTLFVRNLPEGDIERSYTIPFDKFILLEGYSMGPDGVAEQRKPRDRSGRIESVLHTGNFEIVVYHSGLKLFEIAEFDRDSPDFQKQLNQADSKKYLILENGKRVNKDLKMIPKVLQLEFVDDEGVFYGRQNAQELEEEPEFYTIYKLKIVPDEN